MSSIDAIGSGYEVSDIYLYADTKRNTFGGKSSPLLRSNITSANDNSALGYASLSGIFTGDRNTCIGSYAGSASDGTFNENICIGYKAGSETLGNNNVIIGNELNATKILYSSTDTLKDKILIDGVIEVHKEQARTLNNVHLFTINDTYLHDAVLNVSHGQKEESDGSKTPLNNISIDPYVGRVNYHYDDQDDLINNSTSLDFAIFDNNVLSIDRKSNSTYNPSKNYSSSDSPFVEIVGDLRLTGSIKFADGTPDIPSGSIVNNISDLQTDLETTNTNLSNESSRIDQLRSDLSAFIVEGYADGTILPPDSFDSPTTGNMSTKIKSGSSIINGPKLQLVNRDSYLKISKGDFVVAVLVNQEYRPVFVSYGS